MAEGKGLTIADQFGLRIKESWPSDVANVSKLALNSFNEIMSMKVKGGMQPNYRSDMRVHVTAKTGPVIGKASRPHSTAPRRQVRFCAIGGKADMAYCSAKRTSAVHCGNGFSAAKMPSPEPRGRQ
jgi:hypothetical protein